jgi:hypothetical protein
LPEGGRIEAGRDTHQAAIGEDDFQGARGGGDLVGDEPHGHEGGRGGIAAL